MKKYTNATNYFETQERWKEELLYLRSLIVETELEEAFKWNFPVYTLGKKNLIGLGATKKYFVVWFFQGVFLTDRAGLLTNAQEGKTKAMRQWRFTNLDQVNDKLLLEYVEEAIQNQRDGLEMKPVRKKKPQIAIAPELEQLLIMDTDVRLLYEQLSVAKQNEFNEYITNAKRKATKASRLEKVVGMLRAGEGLNDKYR